MTTLTESRLVYLIIYVNDLAVSRAFYEDVLGFQVLEEDSSSVKYRAGHIILLLNRAQDFGIILPDEPDRTAYMAFLVDDLDSVRAALEERGVAFSPIERYEVGATTEFFDPDGHWFALYEPSSQAMTWPSAKKIQAVLEANGHHPAGLHLDNRHLIYLFLFVSDPEEAFEFYHRTLGLRNIEGGACTTGLTTEVDGVIKYDAGGTMLTTHHIDPAKRELDPAKMEGIAPVFHVDNMQESFRELSGRGVRFDYGPAQSEIGRIARFKDPVGHVFYLYEPSPEALTWPSGAKIKQILSAPLS